MSKASVAFDNVKQSLMVDEEFKDEYEKLRPRYEIIAQIVKARKKKDITQAELAKRIGTKKSNISRLESGTYNPSLDFLIKVARALEMELKMQIK